MTRCCELTGMKVAVGNNVSHANNKTKRRFHPNLQKISFFSDLLKERISLRVSVRALRMVERSGGIDRWLSAASDAGLSKVASRLKRRIRQKTPAA